MRVKVVINATFVTELPIPEGGSEHECDASAIAEAARSLRHETAYEIAAFVRGYDTESEPNISVTLEEP